MAEGKSRKKGPGGTAPRPPSKKRAAKGTAKGSDGKKKAAKDAPEPVEVEDKGVEVRSMLGRLADITGGALQFAAKTTETSLKIGRSLVQSTDRKVLEEAGHSLRDLRLVAGMTLSELSDALNVKDMTFLEAVENGTATLSFELILRLSSLLARHDPVPFIIQYTRTYDPDVWRFLEGWGIGRIPVQYERERKFINVYRRHDEVRKLSDEDFEKLLDFTRATFDMALHFIGVPESGGKPEA